MTSETQSTSHRPRRKKLVQPGLQLTVCLWTLCLVAAALTMQFIFTARAFSRIAVDLPGNPEEHFNRFVSEAFHILAVSVGVVLPLTCLVGVLATFRLVGPIARMKGFLVAIQRGERPPDIQLRKGDQLREFCGLLNDVTGPLRRASIVAEPDDGDRHAA